MPKIATGRYATVYGRLVRSDEIRLQDAAKKRGIKPSAFVREAILAYLDAGDLEAADERESSLEKRLKKMEDRLAGLMARTAIDTGMIFQIVQANMNPETKDEDLLWAHSLAVKRLKKKLQGQAAEVKELAKADETKSEADD